MKRPLDGIGRAERPGRVLLQTYEPEHPVMEALVAGDRDEAFIAEQFEPVISAQTKTGVYHVLPGVSHMGVLYGPDVLPIVEGWLGRLSL